MGQAIANIAKDKTGKPPVLVGVSEVENASVIEDLVTSEHLKDANYNFVHYDSPDERGIDVALLVNENYFIVEHSEPVPMAIYETNGIKDYTRHALYVKGHLSGERLHKQVCHRP